MDQGKPRSSPTPETPGPSKPAPPAGHGAEGTGLRSASDRIIESIRSRSRPPTDEEIEAMADRFRGVRGIFPPAEPPWRLEHGLAALAFYLALMLVFDLAGQLLFQAMGGVGPTARSAMFGARIGGPAAVFLLAAYSFLLSRTFTADEAGHLIGLPVPRHALRRSLVPFLAGGGLLLLVMIVQGFLIRQVWHGQVQEQPIVTEIRRVVHDSPYELSMYAVFLVLVAPVTEEVLFRGLLYLPLRAALGPRAAAVVVAAVFAAAHMHLPSVLPLFVLGLALVWLLEATRTLWGAIAGHMLFNAVSFGLIVQTTMTAT